MINTSTRKPLSVRPYGSFNAFISLPLTQLDEVTALLKANEIPHWVDDEALSVDGKPEVIWIYLEKISDMAAAQRILDASPPDRIARESWVSRIEAVSAALGAYRLPLVSRS